MEHASLRRSGFVAVGEEQHTGTSVRSHLPWSPAVKTPGALFLISVLACSTPPSAEPHSAETPSVSVPETTAQGVELGHWRCSDGQVNETLVMEGITLELSADGTYLGTIDFRDTAAGVTKQWHAVNHGRYTIADRTICFVNQSLSMTAENDAAKETDARLKAGGEPTLEESIQARVPSGKKDCYPLRELSKDRLDYGTLCER